MSDISPYFSSTPIPYDMTSLPCQANEGQLYDSLMAEAYNRFGIPATYYCVSYDTTYDPTLGEDNNMTVNRAFQVMVYYPELPPEAEIFHKFGIEQLDNFHMYISKAHFAMASTYTMQGFVSGTSGTYQEYIPQIADIIRANYNGVFYEVVKVRQTEAQFLQLQHSWDILVKVAAPEHYNIAPCLSGDDIVKFETIAVDVLNVTSAVDVEKPKYLYDGSGESTPPRDPFSL